MGGAAPSPPTVPCSIYVRKLGERKNIPMASVGGFINSIVAKEVKSGKLGIAFGRCEFYFAAVFDNLTVMSLFTINGILHLI
jgi:hypothetical protein